MPCGEDCSSTSAFARTAAHPVWRYVGNPRAMSSVRSARSLRCSGEWATGMQSIVTVRSVVQQPLLEAALEALSVRRARMSFFSRHASYVRAATTSWSRVCGVMYVTLGL